MRKVELPKRKLVYSSRRQTTVWRRLINQSDILDGKIVRPIARLAALPPPFPKQAQVHTCCLYADAKLFTLLKT